MDTNEALREMLRRDNYYTQWHAAKELDRRGELADRDLVGTYISLHAIRGSRDLDAWDRCCRSSGIR